VILSDIMVPSLDSIHDII